VGRIGWLCFNEGRHAHAAESTAPRRRSSRCRSFNEGRHAHAAESRKHLGGDHAFSRFNEGRHAHAAEWAGELRYFRLHAGLQ